MPSARVHTRYTIATKLLIRIQLAVALAVLGHAQTETSRTEYWAGPSSQIFSSPTVGPDGTVYAGVSYATSPETGAVLALKAGRSKWTALNPEGVRYLPNPVIATPTLSADGKTLYVLSSGRVSPSAPARFLAIDSDTGQIKVDQALGVVALAVGPAVGADGTLYFGASEYSTTGSDSHFYAFTPGGVQRWSKPAYGFMESSASIGSNGLVYYGSHDGFVYARDATTGEERWKYDTDAAIYNAPAIGGDGTVYVGSDNGLFYAFEPSSNTIKWTYEAQVGAGAALGADGTVYIGTIDSNTTGSVHALVPNPGGTVGRQVGGGAWPYRASGRVLSVPAVRADGAVIFASEDGTVHAVDRNGVRLWAEKLSGTISSSPVIARDGSIHVTTEKGHIVSFRGNGIGPSTYSTWPMFARDQHHSARAEPPIDRGRLLNLSTRGFAGPSTDLVAGFVIGGARFKQVLIRGAGPALKAFGLTNAHPDPAIVLTSTAQNPVEVYPNDNWETEAAEVSPITARVGAFPFAEGSRDAAMVQYPLPGRTYTATLHGTDPTGGTALVEIYDAEPEIRDAGLMNLSTRGIVSNGDMLVAGLVTGGEGKIRLLLRAIGPALTQFGVNGVLQRPTMTVYNSAGQPLASNTGWGTQRIDGDIEGATALVQGFPLPRGSADCAMIYVFDPGLYTVVVSGVDGSSGVGLVEVYALPH